MSSSSAQAPEYWGVTRVIGPNGGPLPVSFDDSPPVPVSGGFQIPAHDNRQLSYTGDNLTSVAYRVGSTTVATVTLSYTGSRLDSISLS